LTMLRFQKDTCKRYTRKQLVECRCLRTPANFGVFSAPRFRVVQGSSSGCHFYSWHNDTVNAVVLLAVLAEGQQCQFLCEVDMFHVDHHRNHTFDRLYTVTHSLSRAP
ncbi:unnamed protein product, partial [Candidula unifasciata]